MTYQIDGIFKRHVMYESGVGDDLGTLLTGEILETTKRKGLTVY